MKLSDVMHLVWPLDYLDAKSGRADHWLFDYFEITYRASTGHLERMKLSDWMHLVWAVDHLNARPDGADHWLFDYPEITYRASTGHLVDLGRLFADPQVDRKLFGCWWRRCQGIRPSD